MVNDILKRIIVRKYNDYKKTNLTVNNITISGVGVHVSENCINYKYTINNKNYTYIGSLSLGEYNNELRKEKLKCLLKK